MLVVHAYKNVVFSASFVFNVMMNSSMRSSYLSETKYGRKSNALVTLSGIKLRMPTHERKLVVGNRLHKYYGNVSEYIFMCVSIPGGDGGSLWPTRACVGGIASFNVFKSYAAAYVNHHFMWLHTYRVRDDDMSYSAPQPKDEKHIRINYQALVFSHTAPRS